MADDPRVEEFRTRRAAALAGGSEKARARQLSQGKLLVRDRLAQFLDEAPSFEDGLLAGTLRNLPGDAVVTAVGKVDGREVVAIANDMTVKAGSWGYQTFLKITQAQTLAAEARLPIVYLIDSAGARIDEQADCYLGRRAWGNIFYNQVQYSGVVPQLCLMFGPSPAGSAYVPALSDVTFMVEGQASAYLGSPRMAEVAIGEKVTEEQMGGARMHNERSGLGDLLCPDEATALAAGRKYLGFLPSHWQDAAPLAAARPAKPGREIAEIVPADQNRPFDVHELVDRLVDADSFLELKPLFARELVTGLARLGGRPVGVVANNSAVKGGVLFNDSSDKAARFIWLCNAFNVPLLFLQDISGYMIGSAVERAGIIRHGAKLLLAVCEATVPRIAVMVRKGYGGGYLAMSGAPTQPDAQLALPTAMPALMGPEAAVNATWLNQIQALPEDERAAFVQRKTDEYARDINAWHPADRFSFEAVLEGHELRDELIRRFAVYARRPARRLDRRNGVWPV